MDKCYKLSKLRKISLAFGYFLVFVWIFVCLMPHPPDTSVVAYGDKIAHFVGYAILFLWFAQIYQRNAQLKLACALILLGIFVEVMQSFTDYRSFEVVDMLANTTGVFIGWMLAATRLASLLNYFENIIYD